MSACLHLLQFNLPKWLVLIVKCHFHNKNISFFLNIFFLNICLLQSYLCNTFHFTLNNRDSGMKNEQIKTNLFVLFFL